MGLGEADPRSIRPFWPRWGLVPAFLLHDGEEAWFLASRGAGVVALFTNVQTTVAESIAAMAIELVLFTLITCFAWRATDPRRAPVKRPIAMPLFVLLMSARALHGVGHLVGAVIAPERSMGSYTALPLCVLYGGGRCIACMPADG